MHWRKKNLGLDFNNPATQTLSTAFHVILDHDSIVGVIFEMIRGIHNNTDFNKEDGE